MNGYVVTARKVYNRETKSFGEDSVIFFDKTVSTSDIEDDLCVNTDTGVIEDTIS